MKATLNEITVNGTVYVPKDTVTSFAQPVDGLQEVMIRSANSGVHFGFLEERDGDEVRLINSRRVFYWSGAASLSQLATEGSSKPNDCKIAVTVPEITVFGVCEIIPLTETASKNLNAIKQWKA